MHQNSNHKEAELPQASKIVKHIVIGSFTLVTYEATATRDSHLTVLALATLGGANIDIESLQNRLLKVCHLPATSARLPRVSFFFSFLFVVAAAINSTNEANKAGGMHS